MSHFSFICRINLKAPRSTHTTHHTHRDMGVCVASVFAIYSGKNSARNGNNNKQQQQEYFGPAASAGVEREEADSESAAGEGSSRARTKPRARPCGLDELAAISRALTGGKQRTWNMAQVYFEHFPMTKQFGYFFLLPLFF